MSLTNPNTPVSQQDLQDFYHKLLPYMGGSYEMIANKFSKGDMYSTDEKMIGQWIDGKPLYQKVIQEENVSFTTSFKQYGSIGVSNINVKRFDYLIHDGNDNVVYGQNVTEDATESYAYINESTGDFYLKLDKNWTSAVHKIIVIVQYTKTTDSAISIGDDTDYSTEEKIIGTWIDGKPIYQKTFTGLNVSCVYNSWVTIVSAPANIDTLLFAFPLDIGNKVFPSIECRINSGNIQGENTMASTTRIVNVLTIQYTKTTD